MGVAVQIEIGYDEFASSDARWYLEFTHRAGLFTHYRVTSDLMPREVAERDLAEWRRVLRDDVS